MNLPDVKGPWTESPAVTAERGRYDPQAVAQAAETARLRARLPRGPGVPPPPPPMPQAPPGRRAAPLPQRRATLRDIAAAAARGAARLARRSD